MHFVIYKNSILATLCSMTGAAFAAMGVLAMINGELNILSETGVIAAGIALMVLADFISRRKAGRTRRKAQQAAFNAAPSARSSHRPTAGAQPFSAGKPVNKSAVAAGLFFLMALLLGFGFRCLSRTPAVVYQQPVQPQPEPQYTAPEPSPDAAAEKDTDVEKQIQACRDLLECGILTRAECEQKIRVLTQRYYGG